MAFLTLALFSTEDAFAAAPKKRIPASSVEFVSVGNSNWKEPKPIRKVVVKPVLTREFTLPNGAEVSMQHDLDSILLSQVGQSQSFSPFDSKNEEPDPCGITIELRTAVTTVELGIEEYNISFGYTPDGALGLVSEISGDVNVKVGAIAMDFSVWECKNGECVSLAAATTTHRLVSTSLEFGINFGLIWTGSSFVHNTEMGEIFRKLMADGLSRLSRSTHFHELTWKARVRNISEDGKVLFDAGWKSRLSSGEGFVVYAVHPSQGECEIYQPVAYVSTTQVDVVSSEAKVDKKLNSRGIRPGDWVMVRR